MKKESKDASAGALKQVQLEAALQESRFMTIIEQYGKNILFLIVGLIALFIIVYRLSLGSQVSAETDYINAEKAFSQLIESQQKQNIPLVDSSLDKLKQILAARPELHAKYDGLIAETMLKQGNVAVANEFASLSLSRLSREDLPFYSEYATTTLTISSGKFSEALSQAVALKEKMQKTATSITEKMEQSYSELLYSFNLLRIAILQQQLGNQKEELLAWKDLKTFIGLDTANVQQLSIDSQLFLSIFNEGKVSLASYIESRENQLK